MGLNLLPLFLGLLMFSFFVTSALIVPFVDLLYRLKLTKRKQAPKKGKVPLYDKLHDGKAGTPTGGGILLVGVISLLFAFVFPFSSHMGVYIRSSYQLDQELFLIFFTFIAFGILGFLDDYMKMFGKPRAGERPTGGLAFGLTRRVKWLLQWSLALIVGYVLYAKMGISILHIPFIDRTWELGVFYIPFAAFIIVFFTNAFNITDGLDGLASGLLLIFLLAFAVIAAGSLDTPLSVFIALWIGAIMAFLYFNVIPARVFLGDTGALAFGATVALSGLLTGSVITLFVIGGIFVAEVISSFIQIIGWKYLKRPLFPIAPIHNTLLAIGWEEPKIVMRAWLVGLMLAIFGLWLASI